MKNEFMTGKPATGRWAGFFLLICGAAQPALFPMTISENRNRLALSAGISRVLGYGSETDYVLGENDFPVTPAHNVFRTEFSFTRYLSKRIGLEINLRRSASGTLMLKDPSDGDRVRIHSVKHWTLTANAVIEMKAGMSRPFMLAGGGWDAISPAGAEMTVTELGYPFTLKASTSKWRPVVNVAAGIIVWIKPRIGLRTEVRYWADIKTKGTAAIQGLDLSAGFVIGF